MITILIFSILSLLLDSENTQTSSPILLNTYQYTGDYITSDKQGNIYVVNKNKVSRYNLAGKNSGDYTWGDNISSVDATDPSRILIFSKNGKMAKYLDGTMNEYSVDINLENLGIETPTCAGADKIDGFWVYDSQQDQIFQINRDFLISNNSYSLSALTGTSFTPSHIKTNDKHIFISDPYRGIIVLSNSSRYIETIPIFGAVNFDINAKQEIAFCQNNKIIIYDINNKDTREIPIKTDNSKLTYVSLNSEPSMLLIMDDRATKVYGF